MTVFKHGHLFSMFAGRRDLLVGFCSTLGLFSIFWSCKENPQPVQPVTEDSDVVGDSSANAGFFADSSREIAGSSQFYFSAWDQTFSTKVATLPLSAALPLSGSVPADKIPYSGYWYPHTSGGTGMRPRGQTKSALEKYDQAFNGNSPVATRWEAAHHTMAVGALNADWSGHCNGWAAAATRHKEPYLSVNQNGVEFEPHDVKALLAEIYMGAKWFFVGGNRCEQQTITVSPTTRADRTVMDICEDINPGTFHAALANWVGRKSYPMIVDKNSNHEVWNYPLYSYSTTMRDISAVDAERALVGPTGVRYEFNPNATQFKSVSTDLVLAQGMSPEPLGNVAPSRSSVPMHLDYILELNSSGDIIGGEWIGNSQRVHPDFMWVALEPVQQVGEGSDSNSGLNVDVVLKLWARSAGLNPDNMPPTLKEPLWLANWGRYPNFDLTLDGGQTGAVFLGKPTRMTIKRREALVGQVAVDITLNGILLTTLNSDATNDMSYSFDSISGLNRLILKWKKPGVDIPEDSIRFHAMP